MLYWVSRAMENSRSFTGTSLTTTVYVGTGALGLGGASAGAAFTGAGGGLAGTAGRAGWLMWPGEVSKACGGAQPPTSTRPGRASRVSMRRFNTAFIIVLSVRLRCAL